MTALWFEKESGDEKGPAAGWLVHGKLWWDGPRHVNCVLPNKLLFSQIQKAHVEKMSDSWYFLVAAAVGDGLEASGKRSLVLMLREAQSCSKLVAAGRRGIRWLQAIFTAPLTLQGGVLRCNLACPVVALSL